MLYTGCVRVYDTMGNIFITAVVTEWQQDGALHAEEVVQISETLQGRGEDDPRQWLRDALVGMLELL